MLGMPVLLKVRHTVEVSFALTVQQHLWKLLNKSLTQGQLYPFQSSDDFIWPHPLRWQCPCMRQWLVNPLFWLNGDQWMMAELILFQNEEAGLLWTSAITCYHNLPDGIRTYGLIATDAVSESEPEAVFLTPSPNAVLPDSTMKRLSGSNDHSTHGEKEGLISTLHFSCCHFLWSCSI